MTTFNCSIVIRAYNEERHIGRLLDGIAQQTLKDVEVILVDSGSSDRTAEIALQRAARLVHIRPDEFTFGRSLNVGISQASAELVVIASAHIYPVYPDWLERLLVPFSDSKVALTYGKQRGNATAKFSEQQVFVHWYPDKSQSLQSQPFCNNANAAIRRDLWEQRPYDETLTGLEDLEWAHWVIGQGYFLSYVAEAEVTHVHDETPTAVYNRYCREAMAFKRIFPQEKFSLGTTFHLVITNITSDLRQAGRSGSLWRNLGSIFWFRWMQFWGTYQGYRHPGLLTNELRKTFYYPRDSGRHAAGPPREVMPIQYNEDVTRN